LCRGATRKLYGLPVLDNEVRWKVLLAAVAVDDHVGADVGAVGNESAFADDGMAAVQLIRKQLVGCGRVGRGTADFGAEPDDDLLVDDDAFHAGAGADPGVVHEDAVLHDGAWTDIDARAEDAVFDEPMDFAPVRHHALHDLRLGSEFGRGPFFGAGGDGPVVGIEVQSRVGLEQLEACFPIGVYGADIDPVAGEGVGKDAVSGGQHGGDDVLAEICAGGRRRLLPGGVGPVGGC